MEVNEARFTCAQCAQKVHQACIEKWIFAETYDKGVFRNGREVGSCLACWLKVQRAVIGGDVIYLMDHQALPLEVTIIDPPIPMTPVSIEDNTYTVEASSLP